MNKTDFCIIVKSVLWGAIPVVLFMMAIGEYS